MNPKCLRCPIAGECNSYQALCDNHAKDPLKWRGVVDSHNGVQPQYPPLVQQAKNLAKSVLTFAKTKCKMVDQAEFDRRHAICEACDQFDAKQNRCMKCACYLAVKPWGKAESCPLGLWKVGDADVIR